MISGRDTPYHVTSIHTQTHTHTYVYTRAQTYTHIHTHKHTRTHIHTHTHTVHTHICISHIAPPSTFHACVFVALVRTVLDAGDTFMPDDLMMHEGTTQPPPLLKEHDLIALMDTNGIGTDATIAEHIQKVKDRVKHYISLCYVSVDAAYTFSLLMRANLLVLCVVLSNTCCAWVPTSCHPIWVSRWCWATIAWSWRWASPTCARTSSRCSNRSPTALSPKTLSLHRSLKR